MVSALCMGIMGMALARKLVMKGSNGIWSDNTGQYLSVKLALFLYGLGLTWALLQAVWLPWVSSDYIACGQQSLSNQLMLHGVLLPLWQHLLSLRFVLSRKPEQC